MWKLIIGILAVSLLLSGCVLNHITVMKMSGDKMGFPVGGIIPISGEDIKGYLVRQFYYTDEKGREIPPAPVVIINRADADDKLEIKVETVTLTP